MNKKDRLEKIRRFVSDYDIGTQEEIVEHLRESGITATQATVSRDIKELGIVKIPLKDNTYIYELPKTMTSSLGWLKITSCPVRFWEIWSISVWYRGAQHWSSVILGMNLLRIFSVSWQTTTVF